MPRDSLADSLADQLLQGIIDGRYPTNDPLPPEADIAKEANVSRLTVREAVKTLRAKSIVRIDRGRGTYTNPPDRWTDLEALVRAVSAQAPTLAGVVPERLIEARRVIETGATELPRPAGPPTTLHGSTFTWTRWWPPPTTATSTPSSPQTSPSIRPCSTPQTTPSSPHSWSR